jgi:hypothetical protein
MTSGETVTTKSSEATSMSSHDGPARYWTGGVLILAVAVALLWLLLSGGGVCANQAATILLVALAMGVGLGFLGSEATTSVRGAAHVPGLGRRLAIAIGGGLAGFAVAASVTRFIVADRCPIPIPHPCFTYGSDGHTCERCVVPVAFSSLSTADGSEGADAICTGMRQNAPVSITFTALAHVDQKDTGGRQLRYSLMNNGAVIAALPNLVDEVRGMSVREAHSLSGRGVADASGIASARIRVTNCIYDLRDQGKAEAFNGTCSTDFAFMDIAEIR